MRDLLRKVLCCLGGHGARIESNPQPTVSKKKKKRERERARTLSYNLKEIDSANNINELGRRFSPQNFQIRAYPADPSISSL